MNQILPDGKRIIQRVEGRVYRDSQGRTRNERTFHVEGSSEQKQTISIHDPLIHVSYTLEPETKIARKMLSLTIDLCPGRSRSQYDSAYLPYTRLQSAIALLSRT